MNVDLIALYPSGSISTFYNSSQATKREPLSPLALPQVEGQCAHVETVYSEDGKTTTHMRCLDDAVRGGRQGWLCEHHQDQLDIDFPLRKRFYQRFPDKDIVENIKLTDARSIARHGVEVVKIGRVSIKFLSGARMKTDPETYASTMRGEE